LSFPQGPLAYEKWDATGNDFVVIDLAQSLLAEDDFSARLVSDICDRKQGVGADGVVLMRRAASAGQPARVVIWNSDGSLGGMCGNALRCVALILGREADPARPHPIDIGGRLVRTTVRDAAYSTVLMGVAGPVGQQVMLGSLPALDEVLGGQGYLLSFGNPHYVLPVADVPTDWAALGAAAQPVAHRLLGTGGINCGFLCQRSQADGGYLLRVFERGAGVTQSCGSGACAASTVLDVKLGVAAPHRFHLPGGTLDIGRSLDGGLELGGPAYLEHVGHWSLS
jgi:diaminopimelate epimerase